MKKTQETLRKNNTTRGTVMYTAFELSNKTWKLAFSNGSKVRYVSTDARDLNELQVQIGMAKKRFGLNEDVRVVSCYEAGRDGFWLHRYLLSLGIANLVVDSSSIEVNRRKRRAKTDRIDAGKLLSIKTKILYVIVGTQIGFPANIASTPSFAILSAENLRKLGTLSISS